MAQVAILGATGMLGSALYETLKIDHELLLTSRNQEKQNLLEHRFGVAKNCLWLPLNVEQVWNECQTGFEKNTHPPSLVKLEKEFSKTDVIINGIGIIKPHALKNPSLTWFVNGVFPHLLSRIFKDRLLHISTDCVFCGTDGLAPYSETTIPSPRDLYGLSKSMGEPFFHSLVFRTSIIGPELCGNYSLVEWVRGQAGKATRGFTQHFWNGVTTRQLGKIIHQWLTKKDFFPSTGLFHLYSNRVSKFEMVEKIARKLNVKLNLQADPSTFLDRTLTSNQELCLSLRIPPFETMIQEM